MEVSEMKQFAEYLKRIRRMGFLLMVSTMFLSGASEKLEQRTTPSEGIPADITITPDPTIQSLIARLGAPTEEDKRLFSGDGEKYLRAKLGELEKAAGGDHKRLVPQLLYSSLKATDTVEALLPRFIAGRIGISMADAATALVPYLETRDERLRRKTYRWLALTDATTSSEKVDFSRYK
jgi:hypothetical protein